MNIYQWKSSDGGLNTIRGVDRNGERALEMRTYVDDLQEPVLLETVCEYEGIDFLLCDMPFTGSVIPRCLSQRAYNALKSLIDGRGTVKQATVNGKPYILFWPSVIVDCLNMEESDILTGQNGFKQLRKPVFFDSVSETGPIFLVPEFETLSVLVTKEFVEVVKDEALTGIELRDADYTPLFIEGRSLAIDEVRALAKELCDQPDVETITTYLIKKQERMPLDTELNRIAGSPIGITDSDWPRYLGKKMHHLVTLDLDTAPALKTSFSSDTKAVSLFLSDIIHHEAWAPDNDHVVVIELTADQLGFGVNSDVPLFDEDFREPIAGTFSCHEVELPSAVFSYELVETSESMSLRRLQIAIEEYDLAAGYPIWLHDDDSPVPIVMQFCEGFVDINMGDGGMMYWFTDTAYTQSH